MAITLRHIAGRAQFLGQQRGGIGLGEQPGFEIHPRRHAQIGVGGPGEAIDAAMLAAAIGIDRLVEGNVRRLVAGDDGAGGVVDDFGAQRGRGVIIGAPAIVPAVIHQHAGLLFIAPDGVGDGAAAAQAARIGGDVQDSCHAGTDTPDNENKSSTRLRFAFQLNTMDRAESTRWLSCAVNSRNKSGGASNNQRPCLAATKLLCGIGWRRERNKPLAAGTPARWQRNHRALRGLRGCTGHGVCHARVHSGVDARRVWPKNRRYRRYGF